MDETAPQLLIEQDWNAIEAQARGQTVTWGMWQGDPYINKYVRGYVAPELERQYGIKLRTVSAQGNEIVSLLMTEREARRTESAFDVVWINGETFYQLRQIDALMGPFTDQLPNAAYIDFANPFIRYDFQLDIDGYELPWGNVQLVMIYDTRRVIDPPQDMAALETWVRKHPGRFTIDTSFSGLTFLKSLLIEIAGGPGSLEGAFDEARYMQASARLWEYMNRIKPYFWRNGATFPAELSQLHQLFVAGEIDFTFSNNDGDVDNKVLQGLFSKHVRGYVLASGTIQNSHYLGVPRGSRNLAGALVLLNFLVSPQAQFEKLKPGVWGDGTVLNPARLPAPWQERFRNIPQRTRVPPREQLQARALREPAAEYMIRLQRDFRTEVLER